MKIIEVYNSKMAKMLGYSITLYPFVLYDRIPTQETRRHESIHINQIRSDGVFKFYCVYLINYLSFRLKGKTHMESYLSIPYEKEAYTQQKDTTINPDTIFYGK